MPRDGVLDAHVGLSLVMFGDRRQRLEKWEDPEPYRVVAGARFGNCLLTLPRRTR